jgi:hypothetical protein
MYGELDITYWRPKQGASGMANGYYRASFIGIRRHRYIEVSSLKAACAWLERNWGYVEEDPMIECPDGTTHRFSTHKMPDFIELHREG